MMLVPRLLARKFPRLGTHRGGTLASRSVATPPSPPLAPAKLDASATGRESGQFLSVARELLVLHVRLSRGCRGSVKHHMRREQGA